MSIFTNKYEHRKREGAEQAVFIGGLVGVGGEIGEKGEINNCL